MGHGFLMGQSISSVEIPSGSQIYNTPGLYTWTVPEKVTRAYLS